MTSPRQHCSPDTKTCSRCKERKPAGQFHRNQFNCKECGKAVNRAWKANLRKNDPARYFRFKVMAATSNRRRRSEGLVKNYYIPIQERYRAIMSLICLILTLSCCSPKGHAYRMYPLEGANYPKGTVKPATVKTATIFTFLIASHLIFYYQINQD